MPVTAENAACPNTGKFCPWRATAVNMLDIAAETKAEYIVEKDVDPRLDFDKSESNLQFAENATHVALEAPKSSKNCTEGFCVTEQYLILQLMFKDVSKFEINE